MSRDLDNGKHGNTVGTPLRLLGRGCIWLAIAAATLPRLAAADEPFCDRQQIEHRAYKNAKSNKPRDTAASLERELAPCKDKLKIHDHLDLLIQIVRSQLEVPYPNPSNEVADLDGCRRVAESGMRLLTQGGPYEEINTSFGYCGGDCSKAACAACCEDGVQKRKEDLKRAEESRKAAAEAAKRDKMSEEERDMERDVPCDFGKARGMATRLDKAGFGGSAIRLIAKYRQVCAKNSPAAEVAALANDEALIHYHLGEDGACLRVLTRIPDEVGGAAFNRTLCGGTCSLDPAKCAKATEARNRAIAARTVQKMLRQKTQALCTSASPAHTGLPPWDISGNEGRAVRAHNATAFTWGDVNGDGLGDLVEEWEDSWEDTSTAALNGYALPSVRWKMFRVSIGCPKAGDFVEVMERNTEFDSREHWERPDKSDDKIEVRILDQPRSAVHSVCVYPSRNLKCTATKCNREPDQCADFSEWEEIEKRAGKKP